MRTCAWSSRILAVAVLAAAAPRIASAAPTCSFTVTSLNFGTYDPFSAAPLDSTSTITYKCPSGKDATVTIGTGTSGSFSARTLRRWLADTLEYNLFIDAARTAIWGDGTAPSVMGPGLTTKQGGDLVATVYGRIPAGQDASVGVYADILLVTFEF